MDKFIKNIYSNFMGKLLILSGVCPENKNVSGLGRFILFKFGEINLTHT
jgi:hypothetical protein